MPLFRRHPITGLLRAACLALAGITGALAEPVPPTAATPLDFTLAPGPRQALALDLRRSPHVAAQLGIPPSALLGLDPARLDGPPGPVRFTLVREPGRFDCAGAAAHGRASGQCRFTPDADFTAFLKAHGVAQPSVEQALQMASTGVDRALVLAIAEARYPTPTPDQLAGLAALGVDQGYIAELARRGYRPARLDDLTSLKAIGATPAYLAGLAAVGYGALSPSEVAQLRALGVDGRYIQGFQAVGQAHPSVAQLVRMKALGVAPADLRGAAR